MCFLFWSVIQVTILGVWATGLYLVLARRWPGAGGAVAAVYLGIIVALPFAALCPVPQEWSWFAPAVESAAGRDAPSYTADGTVTSLSGVPRPEHTGITLGQLQSILQRLRAHSESPEFRPWKGIGMALFAAGLFGALFRLLLGWFAVRALYCDSCAVQDQWLGECLESLRAAVGCLRIL